MDVCAEVFSLVKALLNEQKDGIYAQIINYFICHHIIPYFAVI